jgi:hypothetical protein
MEQVCLVIKACKECQLIKWIGSVRYDVEDFIVFQYVICFTGGHLILWDHFLKRIKVINTF